MEAADQSESTRLKRRGSSSPDGDSGKCCKYNSLLTVIRDSACLEYSRNEFDKLLKLNFDVDYFDPEVDNCTPLSYAVQSGLLDWTKVLLECGANPEIASIDCDDGSTATVSDIAWSRGDYDIVVELILADAPYPQGFTTDKLNFLQSLRVQVYILKIKNFQKNVEEYSLCLNEYIKEFTENFKKIKHAYDVNNKSALSVALECKNFEVYAFLRSKGFACGVDESHDSFLKELKRNEKKLLNDEIEEYFENVNFHILDLLSMSRLGMNNDKNNFDKLKKYFEKLDKIEEIQPILKIASSDKALSLIFDFDKEDIENLDPVGCAGNSEFIVRGRTYKKTKKILIAAKQRSESDLVGILAQELTHFAILMVYNNQFLPYHSNDDSNKAKYAEVVEICDRHRSEEIIIEAAFKYKKDNEIAAELIARVPQLIAENKPEKLLKNRETFKCLFDYFNQKVSKDFELEANLIKPKQLVRDLNKTLGVLHRMKTFKIRCREKKPDIFEISKIFDQRENIFIPTKLPELALSNIIERSKLNDSENIFVEVEQLTIRENLDSIDEIIDECFKPTIYVIDSINVDPKSASSALKRVKDVKIVCITSRSFDEFRGLQSKYESFPEVKFTFSDLNSESKQQILTSEVDFQGSQVIFKDILGYDLEEIEFWSLEDFLDASRVRLNDFKKKLPKTFKIFMPRSFQISENRKVLNAEDIVAKFKAEKTIVIADVAGMGKTTSAVKFAKLLKVANPLSWIVFFDLKQHSDIFDNQNDIKPPDFELVLEGMIRLKTEIEKKLFKFCFKNAKNIFVIDGFDEISPKYKNVVLDLMKHIQKYENRILVTTRTHLESDIVTELGKSQIPLAALKMLPFSENNQIEFLMRFWRQKQKHVDVEDLVAKARRLIEKFKTHLGSEKVFLENPLQLFMLAELTETNHELLDFDFKLMSLYEHFVKNKLDVYNEKGLLVSSDNTNFVMKEFKVLLFHQIIAIETFFGREVSNLLGAPEIPKTMTEDEICRIGFLQVGFSGRYQFSHRNFGAFFAAQKLIKSVTIKTSSNSVSILHKLLAKVLVRDSHYDENIRSFINVKLGDNDKFLYIKEVSQEVEEILKSEITHGFLIYLIEKKQYNIIKFIFKKLALNRELKMKIMTYKNPSQHNALHVATDSPESWNALWECAESFASNSELKDFLRTRGGIHNFTIIDMFRKKQVDFQKLSDSFQYLFFQERETILSLAYEREENNLKLITPSRLIWNAIEESFEPEHQKAIFFEQAGKNFFQNLNLSSGGLQLGLTAAKKLYSAEELHDRIFECFRNKNVIYVSSPENREIITNFLEEFLLTENEKREYKNLYKKGNIKQNETYDFSEYAMFHKITDSLGSFIQQTAKVCEGSKLPERLIHGFAKCVLQISVQISASQSLEIFLLFWKFFCKNFPDKKFQADTLLCQYKTINALVSATRNKDKSVLKFILKEIRDIFNRELILEATNRTWLIETLCQYAAVAKREVFEMFWQFLQEKLDIEDQKIFFLNKFKKGENVLTSCICNTDESSIRFIIETARSLLTRDDFVNSLNSLDDERDNQNWLADSLGSFAFKAEPETFKIFWSLLQEKLSRNNLKIVFLKRGLRKARVMIMSVYNRNEATIRFVIKLAGELLDREDFQKAVNSTDPGNWLNETLCHYALMGRAETFRTFWSLLQEKLEKNYLKALILARNPSGENVMMEAAPNGNEATVDLIFKEAGKLLDQKDLKTDAQGRYWLAETLCHYACKSSPEVFKVFWKFLQKNNIRRREGKELFLAEGSSKENALIFAFRNKNEATVGLVVNLAAGLLDRKDFEKALKSHKTELLDGSLRSFSSWAEPKTFEMIWQLAEKNLVKREQKSFILKRNPAGKNALMNSAKNKNKATIELVINLAKKLLDKNDFRAALKSDDQDWLVDTLCEYASEAELESFALFWKFLQDNIEDVNDQKLLLLQKNQNGLYALECVANNKNFSTFNFFQQIQ